MLTHARATLPAEPPGSPTGFFRLAHHVADGTPL
jgi:hypothetical protein